MWASVPENAEIPSGGAIVLWIRNGQNDSLTDTDFNNKFGTSLVAGVNLLDVYGAGMANTGDRAIRLTTNVQDELDFVEYNKEGTKDTTADKSIKYRYSAEVGNSLMTGNNNTPTPGTVTTAEAPPLKAHITLNPTAPTVTDTTPATFNNTEVLILSMTAPAAQETIKTVNLYMKDQTMPAYEKYVLTRENGDIFQKEITAVDLTGKQYFDYYFEVCDGTNTVKTPEARTSSIAAAKDTVRLNYSDNATINGVQSIVATSENGNVTFSIDGTDITAQSTQSLEPTAIFTADISQTDTFFKNAVAIGDDVIGVFDEGTYNYWGAITYEIPVEYFTKGQPITISVHAGNKANVLEHNTENADDYVIKNIRLVLQDGRTLRAEGFEDPNESIDMGDSSGKYKILDAKFNVEDVSYQGIRYSWDTTKVADGYHNIKAVSGNDVTEINVQVDNTAPVIETNMQEKQYKGNNVIEATAADGISGIDSITATLDNKDITLPYNFSSLSLSAGTHVLTLTAKDICGNVATKTVTFTIPEENAVISGELLPAKDAIVSQSPAFSVSATDPTGDEMTVAFKKGEFYSYGDSNIKASYGTSMVGGTVSQTSSEGLGNLSEINGFPYQQFDVVLDSSVKDSTTVQVNWEGTANTNSKVQMYVYNVKDMVWDKVDTVLSEDKDKISLSGEVKAQNHHNNKVMKVMVQNGLGYIPVQYAEGAAAIPSGNPNITTSNVNDLARASYDFTFALESDTQYYNENYNNIYQHQLNIHDWLLANQSRMNIQYLFHTGDIVDDMPAINEWENADAGYKLLDDAGFAYGVLAGNHDVNHEEEDYLLYGTYFGESRYKNSPWYGESYKNNRGHYDLISVDGIDFIMVYMGWGIDKDEIDWINQVLQQYPERKAILNFHEYLLISGGIGEDIQKIYNQVVAANPNVCMVLSGHYHNAALRIDAFDDDGDGTSERKVYQMLFDYQKLSEGGLGFIRLMHFDLDTGNLRIRTYSPSLDQYNAGGDLAGKEDFSIPFADLGISSQSKTLSTNSFYVNVYTDDLIGEVKNVQSGQAASYTWKNASNGKIGWYAEITDTFGGLTRTNVKYFTAAINTNGSTSESGQQTQTQAYKAVVSGSGTSGAGLPITVNTGSATVDIGAIAEDIFTGDKATVITMPSVTGVDAYTLAIPAASLSGSKGEGILTFNTNIASINIPDNMLSEISEMNGKKAGITVGQDDRSNLPDKVKEAIGNRPLIQLTLTADEKTVEWNNPDAPVTVSIPYTPTAAELKDPEHITVWYIDSKGNVVEVPSGRYDTATGTVTFTTTHFSCYAIAYVNKTFGDLESVNWAKKPIEVLASKGILAGISETEYAPQTNITRADFLYFLVRTLGVDARIDENFDDISSEAYYYKEIAIAKNLGITYGTGNNKFSPDASITRQDMMVLTEKALRMVKKFEVQGAASDLDKFADKSLIAAYAIDGVASVVKEGLIVGSNNKINPLGNTTRAEAAAFLYKIYNEYPR